MLWAEPGTNNGRLHNTMGDTHNTQKKTYIMALDQGTTSSRCILFDKQGNICSMAQKEFNTTAPSDERAPDHRPGGGEINAATTTAAASTPMTPNNSPQICCNFHPFLLPYAALSSFSCRCKIFQYSFAECFCDLLPVFGSI